MPILPIKDDMRVITCAFTKGLYMSGSGSLEWLRKTCGYAQVLVIFCAMTLISAGGVAEEDSSAQSESVPLLQEASRTPAEAILSPELYAAVGESGEDAFDSNIAENSKNRLVPARPVIAEAEPREKLAMIISDVPLSDDTERQQQLAELKKNAAILEAQSNVLKLVSKIVAPSVVHIESITKIPPIRGSNSTLEEAGSGVIISRNGKSFIITNRHVIRGARMEDVRIKLHDNRIIHPSNAWFDNETDIAVLEISATGLVPALIGDSNALDIGDFVLAVGSPFGLNHSVTFGIISAKSRRSLEIGNSSGGRLQDFLQTDAAINPGNSGGPLVNLRAEVVGINTAIASNSGGNEGIGFSIPIRMVMLIADQLIAYGEVRRAYLGITLDGHFTQEKAMEAGLPRPSGARVVEVQTNSPAAEANFSVGDIVLSFNNIKVEDDKHLYNLVNLAEIGKEIPVSVYRDGNLYKIRITLREKR